MIIHSQNLNLYTLQNSLVPSKLILVVQSSIPEKYDQQLNYFIFNNLTLKKQLCVYTKSFNSTKTRYHANLYQKSFASSTYVQLPIFQDQSSEFPLGTCSQCIPHICQFKLVSKGKQGKLTKCNGTQLYLRQHLTHLFQLFWQLSLD